MFCLCVYLVLLQVLFIKTNVSTLPMHLKRHYYYLVFAVVYLRCQIFYCYCCYYLVLGLPVCICRQCFNPISVPNTTILFHHHAPPSRCKLFLNISHTTSVTGTVSKWECTTERQSTCLICIACEMAHIPLDSAVHPVATALVPPSQLPPVRFWARFGICRI